MTFAMQYCWLIPAIPLASFVLTALLVRPLSQRACGVIATMAVFVSAVLSCLLAWEYFHMYPPGEHHPLIVPWAFEWLRYQEGLVVNVGVLVDPISVLLMVVVTCVSTLVHLYSIGYMRGESGYGRYFAFLDLFTFSMLGLVVAPNIVQTYVFWELVGVSSFLLIGFYYDRPSAVSAAKKAFVVTRFADLGFLVGILILAFYGFNLFAEAGPAVAAQVGSQSVTHIQSLDFLYLTSPVFLQHFASSGTLVGVSLVTVAMVLVYMGAAGKSAMFPLHIWLPDAMEGPTPVSALIHAATMVVAGVYLLARLLPAFAVSGSGLTVAMTVGTFTCLFAAVIAIAQNDIKRVLAFSTLSQIGYMMLALGIGSPSSYTAGMFHLFTHACFKALLFLGAGSVIHAVHNNGIWQMGGLRKKMPITHLTFLVATLAIAGIWPLSGFFSKDHILAAALHSGQYVVFGVAMAVAGLTAFYMFRIYFVAFWGPHRSEQAKHAHEAPLIMWLPLALLALASVAAGFVPMDQFIGPEQPVDHEGVNLAVAIPASAVALLGISLAWYFYAGEATRAARAAQALGGIHRAVKQKLYVDEVYMFITHRVIFHLISRPIAWFDRTVVDGMVNLGGRTTQGLGSAFRIAQTGQVQTYGLWFITGILVALVSLWLTLR